MKLHILLHTKSQAATLRGCCFFWAMPRAYHARRLLLPLRAALSRSRNPSLLAPSAVLASRAAAPRYVRSRCARLSLPLASPRYSRRRPCSRGRLRGGGARAALKCPPPSARPPPLRSALLWLVRLGCSARSAVLAAAHSAQAADRAPLRSALLWLVRSGRSARSAVLAAARRRHAARGMAQKKQQPRRVAAWLLVCSNICNFIWTDIVHDIKDFQ